MHYRKMALGICGSALTVSTLATCGGEVKDGPGSSFTSMSSSAATSSPAAAAPAEPSPSTGGGQQAAPPAAGSTDVAKFDRAKPTGVFRQRLGLTSKDGAELHCLKIDETFCISHTRSPYWAIDGQRAPYVNLLTGEARTVGDAGMEWTSKVDELRAGEKWSLSEDPNGGGYIAWDGANVYWKANASSPTKVLTPQGWAQG
ncbi:hypothetical protein [Corynebacterium heidelbergense]|uniref:hypothetical protein n=1 Tax=Corynebacterium heidelbergense TaxID=2055947 RepID=UPI0011BFDB7C|nr:hypothetical protein [Corynebacterium heidelbergense]WCZ35758.1 hypothetical protein CHEID_00895 [Corynebacterium heidelbergense]